MSNEMIVYQTIKEVCGAVSAVVSSSKKNGIVNRTQLQAVEVRIVEFLAMQRGNAVTAVVNNNLRNIASTCRLIEELNFEGEAMKYAERQLSFQVKELEKIVENMF